MDNQWILRKCGKRSKALLAIGLIIVTTICMQARLFVKSSLLSTPAVVTSDTFVPLRDTQPGLQSDHLSLYSNQNNSEVALKRRIFLGIASPPHLVPSINGTYLNKTNGKHSFSQSCSWDEFIKSYDLLQTEQMPFCALVFRLFPEEAPVQEWWSQVLNHGIKDSEKTPHLNIENPWIMWVAGATLLYPPYAYDLVYEAEKNLSTSFGEMLGETPGKGAQSCDGLHKRKDRIVCLRLSGELVITTGETIRNRLTCWNTTGSSKVEDSPRPPLLSTINCTDPVIKIEIPKQYHIPESDIEKWKAMWEKLIALHSLNAHVEFVTAKFGRDTLQFYDEVRGAKESLQRFGAGPSQINAYHDFPEFISMDPRWHEHLAFRTNHSLPPKGAGYWFWKAPLILHHLEEVEWGDFVAYSDVDLGDHFKWMVSLLKSMLASNDGDLPSTLALYRVDYADQNYTKQRAWEEICPTSKQIENSSDSRSQYAGGWVVVQKTKQTMKFMHDWQALKSDFSLLNDSPGLSAEGPGFQYHLHDQSLLSLLLKCGYQSSFHRRKSFYGAASLTHWEVELFPV